VQRVGVDVLAHLHELAELECGRGALHAEALVYSLGSGEVVRYGANAADLCYDPGCLFDGPALQELLEAPDFHDV